LPALTQSQMQALPDVLASDRFIINFGSIPGYGDTSSDLTLKCMDVQISGNSNERFEVPLGNVVRSFRGKKNYSRTLACTFAETVDLTTLAALRQWLEQVVGTDSGNSQGYINDYSVTAQIQVFDTTGAVADNVSVFRCFIIDLQDHNMQTQSSQAVTLNATFSYDYVEYANTPIL
jgi:hypothetical protein